MRLLTIPKPLLYGGILVFACVGTYAVGQSTFDLIILLLLGILSFTLRRFDFPIAPVIIGLILGPLAEQQMRRALAISQGDASVFLTHPLAASLLALAVVSLLAPLVLKLWRKPRQA